MFEKVNPCHPDKVADRIAGAIVDLAYTKNDRAKIAVEVLLGHGLCTVIIETSEEFSEDELDAIVFRFGKFDDAKYIVTKQDVHLAGNQANGFRCGDNGIFKGVPVTEEQKELAAVARNIFRVFPTDGKYVIADGKLIICQSNAWRVVLEKAYPNAIVNPIGDWTGGSDVDAGCTNRKLGSDMGDGVTGGGLHGKDLSKADVSANIWCHLKAQELGKVVTAYCAIGDNYLHTSEGDVPFMDVVAVATDYITKVGGFEKFAEWGLV